MIGTEALMRGAASMSARMPARTFARRDSTLSRGSFVWSRSTRSVCMSRTCFITTPSSRFDNGVMNLRERRLHRGERVRPDAGHACNGHEHALFGERSLRKTNAVDDEPVLDHELLNDG